MRSAPAREGRSGSWKPLFPLPFERAGNTGNAGTLFPDAGETSPDNPQIVSCYSTEFGDPKSALKPYRISVFGRPMPRHEVRAQILSCIFPDYGGWRLVEFAPGFALHELAPS